jgi:alpha-amylase
MLLPNNLLLKKLLQKKILRLVKNILSIAVVCGIFVGSDVAAQDISAVAVTKRASVLPKNWQYGGMMEIFVRSYKDTNGDGIGDLKGVTQSLDYLKSLGVKGIWLMPIHPSQDKDHGYAVSDFRAINPEYGTLNDFDELIAQAHKRGIGVIMDYVINHSAADNPIFLDSASSPNSRFRDWFVWEAKAPEGWDIFGNPPWNTLPSGAYLAQFSPNMPDFNFRNPQVMAYHENSIRFWLNRGLDGIRLDAVAHMVENGKDAWYDQAENVPLIARLRKVVEQYDNRYLVCESTASEQRYVDACGSVFSLKMNETFIKAAKGEAAAVSKIAEHFKTAPASMAILLGNHDAFAGVRVWDQLNGNQQQYRLAAATYLLHPGVPFVYYGEEIGMALVPDLKGDPALRGPMIWNHDPVNAGFSSVAPYRRLATNAATNAVSTQANKKNSLWNYYRQLLKVRQQHPSLLQGNYQAAKVDGAALQFQRRLGKDHTFVAINFGDQVSQIQPEQLGGKRLQLSFESASVEFSPTKKTKQLKLSAGQQIQLPPQSVFVWKVLP